LRFTTISNLVGNCTGRSPGSSRRAGCDRHKGPRDAYKDDRDRPRLLLDGSGRRGPVCQDDVGLQADQLPRERSCPIGVIAVPPKVHPHVAAIGPTQVRKRSSERRDDSSPPMSTPTRRTRSPCCARAASGHAGRETPRASPWGPGPTGKGNGRRTAALALSRLWGHAAARAVRRRPDTR
jgi:hypothetical protein